MLVGDTELSNGLQLQTGEDIQQTHRHGFRPTPETPWSAEAKTPSRTAITGAYGNWDIGAAKIPGYHNLPEG